MTAADDVRPSFLVWEDPPRSAYRGREDVRRPPAEPDPIYLSIAAELRENPRRWARIAQFDERMYASTECTRLAAGREAAFLPSGDFEFTARTGRIYARYLGGAA